MTLTIGRARGGFPGRPRRRAYELRILRVRRPRSVRLGRRRIRWSYSEGTVVVRTGRLRTRRTARLTLRY